MLNQSICIMVDFLLHQIFAHSEVAENPKREAPLVAPFLVLCQNDAIAIRLMVTEDSIQKWHRPTGEYIPWTFFSWFSR